MIDIESKIVSSITSALETLFPGITVASEYVPDPADFPHVSVEEIDNYTYLGGEDSSGIEKYANIVYEVNVHTNSRRGKKSKAKKILAAVDDLLIERGFVRTMKTSQQLIESTVYRLIARYSAIVSQDHSLYRR